MSSPKRILIAGAGIAGPALAWFLTRNGHTITIVERAPELRSTGQQVDVAGKGVDVVKMMGLWDALKDRSTGDAGIEFVDANKTTWAAFPADSGSGGASFVREIEIQRGDMADVLYQATKNDVEYVFGDFITGLSEQGSHVTVSFNNSSDRDFDLVVAADGLFSKTRDIAFGKSVAEIKSLKQVCALMSIPYEKSDGTWSKWFNAPGGRCVVLRPQAKAGLTGAYLSIMTPESGRLARLPLEEQKAEFTRLFQDVEWEAPRVLREMKDNDTVYVQETAQVKTPSWVKGRVVLVGDAGYCPSPVSGEGTTLAFVGAYILAGCICAHDDVGKALETYEEQVRPFVQKSQRLGPGVPGIANPQTAWGIKTLYTVIWLADLVMKIGVIGLLGRVFAPLSGLMGKELELPRYAAMSTTTATR